MRTPGEPSCCRSSLERVGGRAAVLDRPECSSECQLRPVLSTAECMILYSIPNASQFVSGVPAHVAVPQLEPREGDEVPVSMSACVGSSRGSAFVKLLCVSSSGCCFCLVYHVSPSVSAAFSRKRAAIVVRSAAGASGDLGEPESASAAGSGLQERRQGERGRAPRMSKLGALYLNVAVALRCTVALLHCSV